MATGATKNKTGGFFPIKLRGLLHDVKGLTRDFQHRHRRGKSEPFTPAAKTWTFEDSEPATVSINASDRASSLLCDPRLRPLGGFSVQVILSFDEPLNYTYSRTYEASPAFQGTDDLCEALLRRVDHCCQELITRKDSSALDRTSGDGSAKPRRFEVEVQIVRGETETWAARTFQSFQRQPLAAEAAREVILSTHSMVGLFMRIHDEGFVWKDGAVRDDLSQAQGTFPYRPSRVQPMACIPRSFFVEKMQCFESIPGYSLKLSFTSWNHRCKPPEWSTTLDINSGQTAPLSLRGAEKLFFDASFLVESVFRVQRQKFEKMHEDCAGFDGCRVCRPHEGDGLDLKLVLVNNLGPRFDHLERILHATTNIFTHAQAQDCAEFVHKIESVLSPVRDEVDDNTRRLNDLEFRITELRGRGWTLDEPILFTLDSINSYSRRSIEAILDRVQTGVADILRGNAIAVRMTAHKRGHFILDKTLVSREPLEHGFSKRMRSPQKAKAYTLEKLRKRIAADIEIFCKDTCSISTPKEQIEDGAEAAVILQKPVSKPTSGPSLPSDALVQSRGSTPSIDRLPIVEAPIFDIAELSEQLAQGEMASDITTGDEEIPTPLSEDSILQKRRRITSMHDPETGARAFPLRPISSASGEKRQSVLGKRRNEEREEQQVFKLATNDEPIVEPVARTSSKSSSVVSRHSQDVGSNIATTANKDEEEPEQPQETPKSPQTPSLVLSSGPSARSSLLITPKAYEKTSSAEPQMFRNVGTGSDIGDDEVPETACENLPGRRFWSFLASPPATARASPKPDPAPAPQDEPTEEPVSHNIANTGIADEDKQFDSVQVSKEQQVVSKDDIEDAESIITASKYEPNTEVLAVSAVEMISEEAKMGDPAQVAKTSLPEPAHENDRAAETAYQGPLRVGQQEVVGGIVETEIDFCQSRLDFEFSSPPTVTTGGNNSPEDAVFPAILPPTIDATEHGLDNNDNDYNNRTDDDRTPKDSYFGHIAAILSPDPSDGEEDDDDDDEREGGADSAIALSVSASASSSPSLQPTRGAFLAFQSQRKSFGSAGYLGFHEQRLQGINLRRALGGSGSPSSASGSGSGGSTPKRSMSVPGELRSGTADD